MRRMTQREKYLLFLLFVVGLGSAPVLADDENIAFRVGPGMQSKCVPSTPNHIATRGTWWCRSSDANRPYYTYPNGTVIDLTAGGGGGGTGADGPSGPEGPTGATGSTGPSGPSGPSGPGTVTSVATGTGLSGGPITSTGTVSLANTAVAAGSYGDATHAGTFTVDAQGRLTAASSVSITGLSESAITSLVSDLAAKATDSLVVHLAGNAEVITGSKTINNKLTFSGMNASPPPVAAANSCSLFYNEVQDKLLESRNGGAYKAIYPFTTTTNDSLTIVGVSVNSEYEAAPATISNGSKQWVFHGTNASTQGDANTFIFDDSASQALAIYLGTTTQIGSYYNAALGFFTNNGSPSLTLGTDKRVQITTGSAAVSDATQASFRVNSSQMQVSESGAAYDRVCGIATAENLTNKKLDQTSFLSGTPVSPSPIPFTGTTGLVTVAWTTCSSLGFAHSWVDNGSGQATCAYSKDAAGNVRLRGTIKSGTCGSSAFTLPPGYRPGSSGTIDLPAYTAGTVGGANGWVDITTAGVVTPLCSVNTYFGVDGVTFPAEQ